MMSKLGVIKRNGTPFIYVFTRVNGGTLYYDLEFMNPAVIGFSVTNLVAFVKALNSDTDYVFTFELG